MDDNFEDKVKEELKNITNTKDETTSFSKEDTGEHKYLAALSYLGPLWLVPFFVARDKSPFTKFHLNQGLLLLIGAAVFSILSRFLRNIPILGLGFRVIFFFAGLVFLAGVLFGLYNALTGKAKELPFIGNNRILD